jgi:ketosteroid isomerase-like protein
MYHQVATFRDGTIVRLEYFTDWGQALEAAGASSPPPPGRDPR